MCYRTAGLAKYDKKSHKSYFSLLQTLHSYASFDGENSQICITHTSKVTFLA